MSAPTPRDVRLDVLAAWRAVEGDDHDSARRVFATCDDPEAAFLMTLKLASMLVERWLPEPGAVDAFITRMVAEEMRDEVDRL